jgi:hypothetical protein
VLVSAAETATYPRSRCSKFFDPRLEGRDVALELVCTLLQDLPPLQLVGQPGFDPLQGLNDRLAHIELVEVAEDIAELRRDGVEPSVRSPLGIEAANDDPKPVVNRCEQPVDGIEAPVDAGELLTEELDELLILAVRHRGRPHRRATYS